MAAARISPKHTNEAGFATVVTMVLCVGLSVLAIAWLNRAQASAVAASQEVERESVRLALRSAIARTQMHLASGAITEPGTSAFTFKGVHVEVEVKNEQEKIDVYRAASGDLSAAVKKAPADLRDRLEQAVDEQRSTTVSNRLGLGALLASIEASEAEAECLWTQLTVHASTVDPLASVERQDRSLEGAILEIEAVVAGPVQRDMGREAIVVLTGDRRAPILVLSDRSFRPSQTRGCSDEPA